MLDMLFKSLGIDPATMIKDIADFKEMAQTFAANAKDMQERLARIETQSETINTEQDLALRQ